MSKSILFNFIVDKENKTIKVDRSFNAPLDMVWTAWTDPVILDQWWAPKPWRAETKLMNFSEGGIWHYCMIGPKGEKQWCILEIESIVPKKSFSGLDAFCDENKVINNNKPRAHWNNNFIDNQDSTTVHIILTFAEISDVESILEMGFKEGFTMGLENLDQLLTKSSH